MKNQSGPDILDYLLNNFEHFEELKDQYKKTKDNLLESDPLFEEDIKNQYKDHVKHIICNEIAKDMACSYEDAVIMYEEMGLGDLFV